MSSRTENLSGKRGADGASPRALWLAIPVLVLAALWVGVMPLIDHTLKYDDPIKQGDRLLLAPGITFTPAPGWNLKSGLRTTDKTRINSSGAPAELVSGAIAMKVATEPFAGTPEELLETIDKTPFVRGNETLVATGEMLPVLVEGTDSQGIAEHYTSTDSQGIVTAFVLAGTGVALSVVGPPDQMNDETDAIGEMITSFAFDEKAATSSKAGGQ